MKTNKILSIILAVAMIMSTMSVSVFAQVEEPVAKTYEAAAIADYEALAVSEENAKITVVFSDGHKMFFDSLTTAMNIGYSGGEKEQIIVHEDIEEEMSSLCGNIVTDNEKGVTIKNTIVDEWIYADGGFTIGEGVTYDATGKASGLFVYKSPYDNEVPQFIINGTVKMDCFYTRYAGTKLNINEPAV